MTCVICNEKFERVDLVEGHMKNFHSAASNIESENEAGIDIPVPCVNENVAAAQNNEIIDDSQIISSPAKRSRAGTPPLVSASSDINTETTLTDLPTRNECNENDNRINRKCKILTKDDLDRFISESSNEICIEKIESDVPCLSSSLNGPWNFQNINKCFIIYRVIGCDDLGIKKIELKKLRMRGFPKF